ncbi:hypothetical protein GCM10009585_18990 [Brevibacterium paucivorans]|uniref:hypothetical protein n=1 Tax=Brevibacterium paucivorans TaxID=170994 RepID=UPI0031DCA6DB
MTLAAIALWAATAPPSQAPIPDEELVTPGTIGFLVTLAVVIAGVVLANLAARKVRKIRARDGAVESNVLPVRVDPRQSREEAESILEQKQRNQKDES